MAKVRIVDLDTKWVAHVTRTLVKAGHEVVDIGGDVALVSDEYIDSVPKDIPFAVFTNRFDYLTELNCYRAEAMDFKPKDYENETAIVEVVEKLMGFRNLVLA